MKIVWCLVEVEEIREPVRTQELRTAGRGVDIRSQDIGVGILRTNAAGRGGSGEVQGLAILPKGILDEVENAAKIVNERHYLSRTVGRKCARNIPLLGVGGHNDKGHPETVDVLLPRIIGITLANSRLIAAVGQHVVIPTAPVIPNDQNHSIGP